MENVWRSMVAPLQDWLGQYPWLEWLLQHPLWLLGLALLVIFLFAGLIQAIGRLTENIWLLLLLLPFRLVRWLLVGIIGLVRFALSGKRPIGEKTAAAIEPAEAKPENRLQELLDRLEAIRTEEEAVLKEVKAILAQKEGQ